MVGNIVINNAIKGTLNSINRTQEAIERTSLRLSTGRDVNSALDQPQNFFQSKALLNRASDFSRLIDGIGQSIRTIEESLIGVNALEGLLNQAEAIAIRSQEILRAGGTDPNVEEVILSAFPPPLSTVIQADNPAAYWRLNDGGGTAVNLGTIGAAVNGTYSGATTGAAPLYANGGNNSVDFDGVNDVVAIPDNAQINLSTTTARTVEMVFNADTTAGRQVLYEEGATVNGLTIYIDNGRIHVTGEDDNGAERWFDANISAPINAGQTYHVAFVYSAADDSFTGYLDGQDIGSVPTAGSPSFPSHSGDIGIGGVRGGVQFHDGEDGTASGYNFDGRISDVALYNTALTAADIDERASSLNPVESIQYRNRDFENILTQIDQIIVDANYRGVNLLKDEDLVTDFNEERTNKLVTEGANFSFEGLDVLRNDFNNIDDLTEIIKSVREAREEVRNFGTSLTNDLGIITTRETFTRNLVNNHAVGADDLTIADLNQEGANMLATQTRLELGYTALSLANQFNASILDIVTGNA